MKTAVSVPDPIFRAADKLAHRLGMSRSKLFSTAVQRFMQQYDDDAITAMLNKYYEEKTSALDPALQSIQSRSVRKDEWK